ncbi:hypothetical protein COO91_00164 [Nostoc flagelliforme CCNUN1]|uniref:Uncharacterized protein n=1 Tax=Nostoc flagelliforme CCNUN1 TaxID=2038116 RepID=A0A2K8SFV3_9NOSO|nr:hypothetical protein COO91_00164 [Nostoc flagelliforme CCNUN1]
MICVYWGVGSRGSRGRRTNAKCSMPNSLIFLISLISPTPHSPFPTP